MLVGAAEAVKALEFCDPAESCNPATTYEAGLNAVDLPTGWTRSNVHVSSIVPVTGAGRLVQNVTVDVVSPQGDVTESLTVAKAGPPPPPPPTVPVPTDVCTSATVTARAFSLIFFVIVEVTIPPRRRLHQADPGQCHHSSAESGGVWIKANGKAAWYWKPSGTAATTAAAAAAESRPSANSARPCPTAAKWRKPAFSSRSPAPAHCQTIRERCRTT